jgi:ComF family protein
MQGATADRIAATLLNLVYPSVCPVCEGASDSYRYAPICSECFNAIERYEGPACPVCFEPLKSEHAGTCGACLKDEPPFRRVASFGLHEGALKAAINFLKFKSARGLARELGRMVASMEIPRADIMVSVPLSLKGLRNRGFNQTLLVGRTISKRTGVPLELGLLRKVKDTLPQVGLNKKERAKNLRGAFEVSRKLNGEKVLLLDDVVTTTATVRECAKVLLRAGAGEVAVVSVSRARGM